MILHVESRAGLHGDPEPIFFLLGGSRIDVLHIDDRWFGEDCCYFRVAASDGGQYILRYSSLNLHWELTLYQSAAGGPAG